MMHAFTDSDWAGDFGDKRSISGWVIFIGSFFIAWGGRKQTMVELSLTEAEYIEISEMCKELIFIRNIIVFIDDVPLEYTIMVLCDNTGAIYLSKNNESKHTKYLDTKYHFVRQYMEDGTIKVVFVRSEENAADPFTKNVPDALFQRHYSYVREP